MLKKTSLFFIAFWQALGIVLYCSLVGVVMWRGNQWFGPPHFFLGPAAVLALLVVSVLVCGLLTIAYPAFLFWEKQARVKALKLVGYTALWLAGFIFLILLILTWSR